MRIKRYCSSSSSKEEIWTLVVMGGRLFICQSSRGITASYVFWQSTVRTSIPSVRNEGQLCT